MKILIASDHGGFALKEQIEFEYDVKSSKSGSVPRDAELVDIIDLGPHALEPDDDYPAYAFNLASQLKKEQGFMATPGDDANFAEESLGILVCRSGNGMAIAANKIKFIRAALCFTPEHAVKAREHNFANILVLDADYNGLPESMAVVDAFIHAKPQVGGRHERRINQILEWENK